MMEEAKKRDHRKLGKELGLFMMRRSRTGIPVLPSKGNGTEEYSCLITGERSTKKPAM